MSVAKIKMKKRYSIAKDEDTKYLIGNYNLLFSFEQAPRNSLFVADAQLLLCTATLFSTQIMK